MDPNAVVLDPIHPQITFSECTCIYLDRALRKPKEIGPLSMTTPAAAAQIFPALETLWRRSKGRPPWQVDKSGFGKRFTEKTPVETMVCTCFYPETVGSAMNFRKLLHQF